MEAVEETPKVLRHGAHDPGGLVTVAADRPFDMDGLPLGRLAFTLTYADAGIVRVDAGPARYVEIVGTFTVVGGAVTGGTASQIRLIEGGVLTMNIGNVPANALALVNGLLGRNVAAVDHQMFGGADEVTGSGFADTLNGHGGDDTLLGGDGPDFIRGLEDADVIEGGAGDDDLNGNTGGDVVRGGAGADTVRGGQDNDYVFGGDGDDPHLNGNLGDDEVFGGNGRDTLFGGQGNDMLFGEAGDDLLSGDLGADTLTGGGGADRFVLRAGGGFDWISDFSEVEGDRIQLDRGVAYTLTSEGGQYVVDLGGGARIGLAGVGTFSADWIVQV